MLEHVADNKRKVFLCHYLLAVAEFSDALGDTSCLLRGEFKSQLLEVAGDIRLAAVLAKSIFTFTSESLRHQVIAV